MIEWFDVWYVIIYVIYRRPSKLNKWKRYFSDSVKENEPIKFSTSQAAKRKLAVPIYQKKSETMPWYQPYSVVGSVAAFLIYFCVLREENDVDTEFTKTLYDRIKGLEKEQLLQSYRYNKENGKSVEDIERRLREIELEEAQAA